MPCTTQISPPGAMPSVEIVAELPRNTMGKLLKRELRDPYWKGRERNV